MDLYGAMRIFVRVAELRSFSSVARELNLAQSTVSKQVFALEEHLGARLLSRTTRTLSLTAEGLQFYERGREILEALAEAEATIGAGRASPSGLVRLGCPATFGRLMIAPRLRRLLARYPQLRVEIVMNDAFVDLVEGGLDLAVRIGVLADQTLIARRVGMTRRAVFGSPAYFAERGSPNAPPDLRSHNCIVYTPSWRRTSRKRMVFHRSNPASEHPCSGEFPGEQCRGDPRSGIVRHRLGRRTELDVPQGNGGG